MPGRVFRIHRPTDRKYQLHQCLPHTSKNQTGQSVDYFMRNPLGNHHIILMGDHEKVIHEFMQLNSCKLVE